MKKFYAVFFSGALIILLFCNACIYLPASSRLQIVFAVLNQVSGWLQILSIPGLMVLLPITGIWLLFRRLGILKKRFQLVEHSLTSLLGLCIVAFITLFLSVGSFHSEYLRNRAANRAILRAEPLSGN